MIVTLPTILIIIMIHSSTRQSTDLGMLFKRADTDIKRPRGLHHLWVPGLIGADLCTQAAYYECTVSSWFCRLKRIERVGTDLSSCHTVQEGSHWLTQLL